MTFYGKALMVLTTLALADIAYQQNQNGKQNVQVGLATTQLALLAPPLNCLWLATATAAVIRSEVLSPTAYIGAVRLNLQNLDTWTSLSTLPTGPTATERRDTLFVALRIDNFTLSAALAESKGD